MPGKVKRKSIMGNHRISATTPTIANSYTSFSIVIKPQNKKTKALRPRRIFPELIGSSILNTEEFIKFCSNN
jgi:hypothetical protein